MQKEQSEVHVKGFRAAAVAPRVLKVLALRGRVVQNQLIDEVGKALPKIDSGTVSSLTRQFLGRWRGKLVKLEQEVRPKRNYWCLTEAGLNQAYATGELSLHEFSVAFSKTLPASEPLHLYYRALAKSKRLADVVFQDMEEYDTLPLEARNSLERNLRPVLKAGTLSFRTGILPSSIIKRLNQDNQARSEVGSDLILALCDKGLETTRKARRDIATIEKEVTALRKLVATGSTRQSR